MRRRWFVLLVLAAAAGVIAYPPAFLFAVREALTLEAWRYGFALSIGDMEGSVLEPIGLDHAKLSRGPESGAPAELTLDKAHATLDWRHLFWRREARVWRNLAIDGLHGSIGIPSDSAGGEDLSIPFLRARGSGKLPRLLLPASLRIDHADIVVRHDEGSIRFQDVDLDASDSGAGHLVIGALSVQEPWMTAVFSNCRGALEIDGSRLSLAGMKLSDSLKIASASADLPALLRGELQLQFALDAFGGNIQGDLASNRREGRVSIEGSGTFANISVAQLAAFFGEDAEGVINQGKFTFAGSPRDLTRATFTTRFEAGRFRWGARRWNSLTAGATYVDHRLQHLEFNLTQAHNALMLKGDMSLPRNWSEWWKTDFSFDVAAKIDNLSELSALLGPGFGNIYGKLTIDGSVRGENASFNGQLIASGSRLSFRKAPLDELQAAVKLQGNEIQITNAEFIHGDDFARVRGVVNILGERRYWGEVKANIADLALYSSIMQPPIAPGPFGGGLMLDWSGDGTAQAHSGAFSARLNRIHPLTGGTGGGWQPVDVTADATYSPDSIFFSNLVLVNGWTTLASRVVATPASLSMQDLKLIHEKSVWLSGEAELPLNVWAVWRDPEAAVWWNFQSPCKLNLHLDKLSLGDALDLTGRGSQAARGEISGTIKTEGTLSKLMADGRLTLAGGSLAMASGTVGAAAGIVDFKAGGAALSSGSATWNGSAWLLSGSAAVGDMRKPALDLALAARGIDLPLAEGLEARADLNLRASGLPVALSGTATLRAMDVRRHAGLRELLAQGSTGLDTPLGAPNLRMPWPCALNIAVTGTAPLQLANASGTVAPALTVSGSAPAPRFSGRLDLSGFTLGNVAAEGTLFLTPAGPAGLAFILTRGSNPADILATITGTVAEKHVSGDPAPIIENRPVSSDIQAPRILLERASAEGPGHLEPAHP